MFADTDFLLALLKPSDWLKDEALKILKAHKGEIRTTISCIIELALLSKRLNLYLPQVFSDLFSLVKVSDLDREITLRASVYIEKYNLNVFDAFHAAYCNSDTIISSDSIYDKIGLKKN